MLSDVTREEIVLWLRENGYSARQCATDEDKIICLWQEIKLMQNAQKQNP